MMEYVIAFVGFACMGSAIWQWGYNTGREHGRDFGARR